MKPNALLKSELDGARACATLALSHLEGALPLASIAGLPVHRLGLIQYHIKEAEHLLGSMAGEPAPAEISLPTAEAEKSVIKSSDDTAGGESLSPTQSSVLIPQHSELNPQQ